MAKPWAEREGSSFHVHQSVWSPDGERNLCAGDDRLVGAYLAGLLAKARELTALGSPNVNSYKRFREGTFAPTAVGWGVDHRLKAARALWQAGAGSRIEYRAGSADANPYLVIAANLAAGLYGVEEGLATPAPEATSAPLPRDLGSALDLLTASDLARRALGDAFVEQYVAFGRHEAARFAAAVTDYERRRYLETV